MSHVPGVPRWAVELTKGTSISRRIGLDIDKLAPGENALPAIEVVIRTGVDAALVSVMLDGVGDWTVRLLEVAVEQMIGLSIEPLRGSTFDQPARLWNFLPGICTPIGDGLDRYRVFNVARHRAFAKWFGDGAIAQGQVPPASCIGHAGLGIAIHAMGVRIGVVPVENPRQVSAFAYSPKFGPRPPCFARAGLTIIGGRPILMVAGTASVVGEGSAHEGSLEAQLRETMMNLQAVIAEAQRVGEGTITAGRADFTRVLATRVYYRRREDRAALERMLPTELMDPAEVEFVHAEICRNELLIEIEVLAEMASA